MENFNYKEEFEYLNSINTRKGINPKYYSGLNWNICVKKLILQELNLFRTSLSGLTCLYISDLKDDIEKRKIPDEETYYGDTVSIRFGSTALPLKPLGKQKVLIEKGTNLVFSYSMNGSVVAIIYPSESEISTPERKFYVVGAWENSLDLTTNEIRKILSLFLNVQLSGSVLSYSRRIAFTFAKLESRHLSITEGRNKIFTYIKYITSFFKYLRKIYGLLPQ
ncbi:hypothetical protein P7M11_07735 [Bisgaard Taxon 10/6]|uniref:hypothetical protein n=1 Tax=Exercitatus varius TaxID=67857 RepID=UPI00294B5E4A|nr:hypothetical protein [Exercitatus varius]MDG2954611.1 hypothetical protein [Exercitatus varius]